MKYFANVWLTNAGLLLGVALHQTGRGGEHSGQVGNGSVNSRRSLDVCDVLHDGRRLLLFLSLSCHSHSLFQVLKKRFYLFICLFFKKNY